MESLIIYEKEFITIYKETCRKIYNQLFLTASLKLYKLETSSKKGFSIPTIQFVCNTKGTWNWLVTSYLPRAKFPLHSDTEDETFNSIASVMTNRIFIEQNLDYNQISKIVMDSILSSYRIDKFKFVLKDILYNAYVETQEIEHQPQHNTKPPNVGENNSTKTELKYDLIINITFSTINVYGHEYSNLSTNDLVFKFLVFLAKQTQGKAINYKTIYRKVWGADPKKIDEKDMKAQIHQVVYNKIRKLGKKKKTLKNIIVSERGTGIKIVKDAKILLIEE